MLRRGRAPKGSCGYDPILAVGANQVLFWCGPNQLFVLDAASGDVRTVIPRPEIYPTSAHGTMPGAFGIGRRWILQVWPEPYAPTPAEVDWRTGLVARTSATRTHWLDLDSPGLLSRPCVPRTGLRVLAQRDGYALLRGGHHADAELVQCGHPRRRLRIIGDNVQLGGGWLTWRDHRSVTEVSALRPRDHRRLRFRLPFLHEPSVISVAHTRDRIFIADDLQGTPTLRTAPLPRR